LSATPAIALGVDDVSMRELIAAYSIFPNLGVRVEPHLIEKVESSSGDEMYAYEVQRTEALDPAVAYVMHVLMRGVVIRGTAARLNEYGLDYVAGKTGTTSNYRDAWFVGYTPDLLTAVWVGFDDGKPLRMSSGEAAVPIWGAFMSKVPHKQEDIASPQGVSVVEIEALTGRVWQPGCGPSVTEAFLSGTEPRDPCGGVYDPYGTLSIYMEPGIYNDSMAAAMYPYDTMTSRVEAVADPDLADMPDLDTAAVSVDTADIEPTPVAPPPAVKPPEVKPPVVKPPPTPTPQPVPKDTTVDSLFVNARVPRYLH
jgi:membrane peptidoglycan carboxypeptidase